MKTLIIGVLTGLTFTVANATGAEIAKQLVTVVTSADTQKQLRAMKMTMQAVRRGEHAHIMLCGPAGELAHEDGPDDASALQQTAGNNPKGLLAIIVAKKLATAEVCSNQATDQALKVTDLIAGISPAHPADMAKRLLLSKGKYGDNLRVLSF